MLEEAIESFLRQDYQGPKEMVIFNSFVPHQLQCSAPGVRIVNWHTRPPTLGTCRNLCIEHCQGTHILMLDDDDIILPHFMRQNVEELVARNLEWVKVGGLIWSKDRVVESVRTQPAANQFLFSKKVWNKVGKYPEHNAGEDRVFEERLVANGGGCRVEKKKKECGYIYGWGTFGGQVWHISSGGEDQRNKQSGMVRMQQHAREAMVRHRMKAGKVLLSPHWQKDYKADFELWCQRNGEL